MKFHCFYSELHGYRAVPIYAGLLKEPLPEGQPFFAYDGEGQPTSVTAGPALGKPLPFSRLPESMRRAILTRIAPAG